MELRKHPGKEFQVYRPRIADLIRIHGLTTEVVHIYIVVAKTKHKS